MDLEVIFGERVITTPVYLKMEAHDPLLLSEGVCRQLGIISYHTEVRCSRKISVAGPSRETVDCTCAEERRYPQILCGSSSLECCDYT